MSDEEDITHVLKTAFILTPEEVATLFRVDIKTVVRWAQAGKLPSFITPGGRRRFRKSDVLAAMGIERIEP